MYRSSIAVALMLACAPLAAAQQDDNTDRDITLQGCVTAGVDNDTYVMTDVREMVGPGGSSMPAAAHGRRILFWLEEDDEVEEHIGQKVEVRGTIGELEESEIELKAGPHEDGGLIVEFEGPGEDVLASNAEVGAAVGTTGRNEPEQNDIPTYLVRVDVEDVQALGDCQ